MNCSELKLIRKLLICEMIVFAMIKAGQQTVWLSEYAVQHATFCHHLRVALLALRDCGCTRNTAVCGGVACDFIGDHSSASGEVHGCPHGILSLSRFTSE